MKGDRTLLNLAGFSAFCYGGLQLVSVIVLFIGSNLSMVPTGMMTPDTVLKIYQNGSFGISVFIGLVSFIFLFPALHGFYYFLKKENKNIVQVGILFGMIAYSIFVITNFLQFGLVRWLAFQSHTTSFAMKNDVFLINQVIQFLAKPNLVFFIMFLALWGIIFRRIENIHSWIVGVLFLFVATLSIFVELFAFLEFGKTASVILILKIMAVSVAFILGGTIIFQVANEQGSDT